VGECILLYIEASGFESQLVNLTCTVDVDVYLLFNVCNDGIKNGSCVMYCRKAWPFTLNEEHKSQKLKKSP
jgi:hypothetical protein